MCVNRCKAGVCALTTQQAFTVRNALRSTTIGPGKQPTAAVENRTPVRVSALSEFCLEVGNNRGVLHIFFACSFYQECECHGHAESCHFSRRVWCSTGGTSGGVCDDCRHNTAGRRCQRCRPGYRRHPGRPLDSPQACTRK